MLNDTDALFEQITQIAQKFDATSTNGALFRQPKIERTDDQMYLTFYLEDACLTGKDRLSKALKGLTLSPLCPSNGTYQVAADINSETLNVLKMALYTITQQPMLEIMRTALALGINHLGEDLGVAAFENVTKDVLDPFFHGADGTQAHNNVITRLDPNGIPCHK